MRRMAAGGMMAGIIIGRNLEALRVAIEQAKAAWAASPPRGLAFELEDVTLFAAASGKQRPVLKGTIGSTALSVVVRSDGVHLGRTEIVATPAEGAPVKVGVHPSPGGLMGYLREWIGQDIQIGDEAFDDAYLITGKPESAAQSLLHPSIRELIVGIGPRFAGFTYAADKVVVVLHGVESDVEALGIAIDLASAAASKRIV